jgi:hypothetical protein
MDSDNTVELFIAILAFGLISLAIAAAVQVLKGNTFSPNFVKLFGLLFVASLATAITFAALDSETRTGAYTILGTIAGYLAGSRGTETGGDATDENGKHAELTL